jgi:hypothetical protein
VTFLVHEQLSNHWFVLIKLVEELFYLRLVVGVLASLISERKQNIFSCKEIRILSRLLLVKIMEKLNFEEVSIANFAENFALTPLFCSIWMGK